MLNRNINLTVVTRLLVIAMLAASMSPLRAQVYEYVPETGDTPLFASHSLLSVTIRAPLTTLMQERPDEEYLNGTFSLTTENGDERLFQLKLRTRGKYRREKRHCDFAPIRLNFRVDDVFNSILAGQDKLKLVTHCKTRNYHYEQLVLREYLAYRILNLLTDESYRVRLMKINYIDTEGGKPTTKLGFVLEDDDHVAARNNMGPIKTGDIQAGDLDRGQQSLIDIFQYMIGNTEYSLFIAEPDDDCCHNSDLMSATGTAPYTPLAYDFDFSGLVNAPYAEPNPRYRLRHVRQRYYKGLCGNNDLLPETIQRFIDRKEATYELVRELELLDMKSRKHVVSYLNLFYKRISDPKSVRLRLEYKCKDKP